ncbi:unnamed protein product [Mesocestoides corti]|uniref:WSC domain-containing protein n=2 Tax=Mesocestoides corti TaxID=53468 RepID=A0A0R3UBD0_MESCO|nr:unnamed protein product [Mesocestoides corti]
MALCGVISLLLISLHAASGLWINYSNTDTLLLMSVTTGQQIGGFERCFANCTSQRPHYDSGLYNEYRKMCYCGTLRKNYNLSYPIVDPNMTAFIYEHGFDCSCPQRILKDMDGMAASGIAANVNDCEDFCLSHNNDSINVAVFFNNVVCLYLKQTVAIFQKHRFLIGTASQPNQ